MTEIKEYEHPTGAIDDTDAYKGSMFEAFKHWFPTVKVKSKFKCRSNVKLGSLKPEFDRELDYACGLTFPKEALEFMKVRQPWIKDDIRDDLEMLKLDRNAIFTDVDKDGQLIVETSGTKSAANNTWFEIITLQNVAELYGRTWHKGDPKKLKMIYDEGDRRLTEFITRIKEQFYKLQKRTGMERPFTLAEFGARRRFSRAWHEHVLERLVNELPPELFVGTSDMMFARQFNIKPIGTFAHELYQVAQGVDEIAPCNVQKAVLELWAKEFRGDLGIALSDIFGFEAFLRDFDKYYAKLYDGPRHDSADPFIWGEKLINHYKGFNIDPRTKVGVWSDSLNTDKAIAITERFCGRIGVSICIGTWLTNNVGFSPEFTIPALNIIMKVFESNGKSTVKLSDDIGKAVGDPEMVEFYKKIYKYKSINEP